MAGVVSTSSCRTTQDHRLSEIVPQAKGLVGIRIERESLGSLVVQKWTTEEGKNLMIPNEPWHRVRHHIHVRIDLNHLRRTTNG